jgi:hypothetical protein
MAKCVESTKMKNSGARLQTSLHIFRRIIIIISFSRHCQNFKITFCLTTTKTNLRTMRSSSARIASFLTLFAVGTEARDWKSVITSEIYHRSDFDAAQFQLKIELDPFFFPGEGAFTEPTIAPNSQDWTTFSPTKAPVTESPSQIPSDFPSLTPTRGAPTLAPSIREKNSDGNGGCNEGSVLYQVNMYDSWGDGWDTSTMLKIIGVEDQDEEVPLTSAMTSKTTTTTDSNGSIITTITKTVEINETSTSGGEYDGTQIEPLGLGTVFQGGLRRGSHGSADVCLKPRRCYDLIVDGETWLDEVSWDIRPVVLGAETQDLPPLTTGGAPMECSFSIPDENGESFCPLTCSNTLHPEHTQQPKIYESPIVYQINGESVNQASEAFDTQYETQYAQEEGLTFGTQGETQYPQEEDITSDTHDAMQYPQEEDLITYLKSNASGN